MSAAKTNMGSGQFVLVVDDDEDVRASIADALVLDGHRVVAVENGEQALGALAVARPRAVVTDLAMPMRSGYSLIERIRSDERTRRFQSAPMTGSAPT